MNEIANDADEDDGFYSSLCFQRHSIIEKEKSNREGIFASILSRNNEKQTKRLPCNSNFSNACGNGTKSICDSTSTGQHGHLNIKIPQKRKVEFNNESGIIHYTVHYIYSF